MATRPIIFIECQYCSQMKPIRAFDAEAEERKFCSKRCANRGNSRKNSQSKTGANNPMFGKRPANFQNHKALENQKMRGSKEYHRWQRAIYKIFDKTCANCGSVDRVVAHHIIGVHDDVTLRFEIDNGVCLCNKCHKLIHKNNDK